MLITRGVAKKLHGESQLHEIHATDFSYCKATHVGCKRTYCAADYQREKSVTSTENQEHVSHFSLEMNCHGLLWIFGIITLILENCVYLCIHI